MAAIAHPLTAQASIPPALSLSDAKDHLRVEHDQHDRLIMSLIRTAQSTVTSLSGVALTRTQYELYLDEFPVSCASTPAGRTEPIRLPHPPIIAVESITYTATDATEQTLSVTDDIEVINRNNMPALVYRKRNAGVDIWPDVYDESNAVRIVYTSGYSDGQGLAGESNHSHVDERAKTAIKMIIGDLYHNDSDEKQTERAMKVAKAHIGLITSGNLEGH